MKLKRFPVLSFALATVLSLPWFGSAAVAASNAAAFGPTWSHDGLGATQTSGCPTADSEVRRLPTSASSPWLIFVAANDVSVTKAWARASPGAASNGAAYVTLVGGAEPDQLVGVSTPVASMAEVHETINDNGVMKMRPVPTIPIPAGKTVTFSPGGYHIMLVGLKQPLVAGQSFPLTLAFAHGGKVTLDVKVMGLAGHDDMGGSMGGHDQMHTK